MQLTKRQFVLTTAAATAGVYVSKPLEAMAAAESPGPWRLDLNGTWEVAQAGTDEWIKATVPGCIHTDLMAAGKIPDPYFRDNERAVQWVGEKDWVYRRKFQVPGKALGPTYLNCEGLDTLATIKINGKIVGTSDNMFRKRLFGVGPTLQAGENMIEIVFQSPLPRMKDGDARRHLFEWIGSHEPQGRAWVRKEPCNFGWDWGPVLITCGIWRKIGLEILKDPSIAEVEILQDHSMANQVGLSFKIPINVYTQTTILVNALAITVSYKGRTVAKTTTGATFRGPGLATVIIKNPHLWWPAGMGEAALYDVHVELRLGKYLLDTWSKRIGLRTMKLLEKDDQNSLRFEVNGVTFFSKGGNYIPADAFANRVTPEILRRYVVDAVAVNMNTLRFWGGGYYEEDALFDACDEMGVCVWLDFKFACSSQPAFDEEFLKNVREEARDQLRRLRDHPCIAVWCGNNEISLMTKDEWSDSSMGRADYDKLFKVLLGDQVKELAPQANYVSGSPDCGDTHYWQVWHGGKTFDDYRTQTGFMSEFGFQSFPEPRTVRAFTNEEDRVSVTTPVMEWHQRSPNGNTKIHDMILRCFGAPKDFESELWLSQILQGYGIKMGAEYWRQTIPKSMGCVFWQYNDCWPVVSWSSVDYFGRWKALHYLARRFYAPILVSGLEDAKSGTIAVFVTSDRLKACRGKLTWQATDPTGRVLQHGALEVEIPARQSRKVQTLDLSSLTLAHGVNQILTWLKVEVDREVVSENLVFFGLPKEIKLGDPRLKAVVAKKGKGFRVTLTAEQPALWAWLSLAESDAKYSDNFIHVTAELPAHIEVVLARTMSTEQFRKELQVRSVFDTYKAT